MSLCFRDHFPMWSFKADKLNCEFSVEQALPSVSPQGREFFSSLGAPPACALPLTSQEEFLIKKKKIPRYWCNWTSHLPAACTAIPDTPTSQIPKTSAQRDSIDLQLGSEVPLQGGRCWHKGALLPPSGPLFPGKFGGVSLCLHFPRASLGGTRLHWVGGGVEKRPDPHGHVPEGSILHA
jgi:hypothetical protein